MDNFKYKPNRRGIQQVMKSPEMYLAMEDAAAEVAINAIGLAQDPRAEFDYRMGSRGKIGAHAFAFTANGAAMRDQQQFGTLDKAL